MPMLLLLLLMRMSVMLMVLLACVRVCVINPPHQVHEGFLAVVGLGVFVIDSTSAFICFAFIIGSSAAGV